MFNVPNESNRSCASDGPNETNQISKPKVIQRVHLPSRTSNNFTVKYLGKRNLRHAYGTKGVKEKCPQDRKEGENYGMVRYGTVPIVRYRAVLCGMVRYRAVLYHSYNTVRYCTYCAEPCGIVWHGTVPCGLVPIVRYGIVPFVRYRAVLYGMARYRAVLYLWYGTVLYLLYGTVRYCTVWYTVLCGILPRYGNVRYSYCAYGTVPCGLVPMVRYRAELCLWYGTVRYCTLWYGTAVRYCTYGAVPCGIVRYGTAGGRRPGAKRGRAFPP